jgi:hypothetical protein
MQELGHAGQLFAKLERPFYNNGEDHEYQPCNSNAISLLFKSTQAVYTKRPT